MSSFACLSFFDRLISFFRARFAVDSLPPEVLSRIFAFLHIEDRKNVRLVSKEWKNCCDHPAIINRERFCFRSGMERIDSYLQTCVKLRSTVEFQDLTLKELPQEDTWRLIGERIHSLSLTHCEISNALFKNIILHCQNLESYEVTQFVKLSTDNIDDLFFSHEILNELIQLNIERRKMISFKLIMMNGFPELPQDFLHKIFKIFPCIQIYCIDHISRTCPSHTGIIIPSSVKELTINVASDCSWLRRLADVSQLKLRKLETICMAESESDFTTIDNLIYFLRNQSELQILEIMWRRSYFVSTGQVEGLLFQILSACPELVDLRLCSETPLEMNSFLEDLQKISKSKLQCLVLNFELICNPNDEVIDPFTPFGNKILHTLKLRHKCIIPEKYSLSLLKHFGNLRRLEITAASDKVLQVIFQYHIHLRELVLTPSERCTITGFIGQSSHSTIREEKKFSISRLSKLEYLEISLCTQICWFEEMLKQFNFPRLTYLRLNNQRLEKVNFEPLGRAVPLVETLILNEVPVSKNQLLLLCRRMPRLKILKTTFRSDCYSCWEKKETMKKMFKIRPSLKYIIDYPFEKYDVFGHYYDHFTKSIVDVNFKHLNFKQRVCGHLKYLNY